MSEKLSVVIVDDSKVSVAQLEAIVAEIDRVDVVGTAHDGLMGVMVIAQRKPDLVLMDIVMPALDGIGALRMLRAKQPDLRVAMVSSVAGTTSRAEEAFRLGAIQVIGKPIDAEQIIALCEAELVRKSEQAEGAS